MAKQSESRKPAVPEPAIELRHVARLAVPILIALLVFRYFDEISRVFLVLYASVIVAVAINGISKRLPLTRRWVAALVGIVLFALFALAIWIGGPMLLHQLRSVAARAPEFQAELDATAVRIRELTGLNVGPLHERVSRALGGIFGGGDVLGRARGVIEFVLLPLLVVFGGLFAAASPNARLLTPMMRAVPRHRRGQVERIIELLGMRIGGWIQGQILAMIFVGTLVTIVLQIIGVPYALLLGVLNGFTEFIPLAGPWMGGIPAVAIATMEDAGKGVWTAFAMFGIQMIEANLILPLTMAKVADVHPFVTLFALFVFGSLFGILGMLLAVPLVLLIWTLVEVFWVEGAIETGRDRIKPVVEE